MQTSKIFKYVEYDRHLTFEYIFLLFLIDNIFLAELVKMLNTMITLFDSEENRTCFLLFRILFSDLLKFKGSFFLYCSSIVIALLSTSVVKSMS